VQETIEHNRTAFSRQVALIERQTVQKAMFAWKTYHQNTQIKKAKLRRAFNRIQRGTLSRAFYHWKDHYQAKDKSKAMRQKV
jgi:hypoxanthine phosphoribosyltransferase